MLSDQNMAVKRALNALNLAIKGSRADYLKFGRAHSPKIVDQILSSRCAGIAVFFCEANLGSFCIID